MNERQKYYAACPEYADRLVDLSDGDLPADERVAVESHVASCDACREELRRLNASLTALRGGIVAAEATYLPHRRQLARTVLIGIGATAAAIVLAIGIASLPKTPTNGRGEAPNRDSMAKNHAPAPNTLTNGQGFESGSMTVDAALRQIALLEQQARLETSLALMPDEPWYAEQRAANEELLSTFRKATMAAGAVDHSPNQTPDTKGTL
jgi:anti-sigma factor RsiW